MNGSMTRGTRNLFTTRFGGPKGRRRHGDAGHDKSVAAAVETLEQKQLLTVFTGLIDVSKIGDLQIEETPYTPPATLTASFENGVLRIDGTDQADQIHLTQVNGQISIEGLKIHTTATIDDAPGGIDVDSVDAASVTQIVVVANGGDDVVRLNSGELPVLQAVTLNGTATAFRYPGGEQPITVKATVYGGDGNDVIYGTAAVDYLAGGNGDDRIYGRAGDDVVIGGAGNDLLFGELGNDKLYGEAGNDWLDGGDGQDWLMGGDGNDRLYGMAGHDWLYGQNGNDILCGGLGNDALFGGNDTDALFGEGGNDWMYGDAGHNYFYGGSDVDRAFADHAGDSISQSEIVLMQVPTDSPQTDGWSCGPNSASRILRSYGYTSATYAAVRTAAQNNSLLSKFGLGTTPQNLVEVMRRWKPASYKVTGTTFQTLLNVVGSGKPAAALISVGTASFWGISYPQLHWVAVTGFDLVAQTISYTDTNGVMKSETFNSFYSKWNWSAGTVSGAVLSALSIRNRTFVY